MVDKLTFDEEIDNVIRCLEFFMERMSDFLVDGDYVSLSEDEMVNDDAKKSFEFLYKAKEIIRGACVLAVYAGEDWYKRDIVEGGDNYYSFGADSYDFLEKYLQGGIELSDKFGTENFYDDYEKYFNEHIKP